MGEIPTSRFGRRSTLPPLFYVVLHLLGVCAFPSEASAGGGPENLFLLVNQNSDASKTIANHYIALRKIPTANVFYLDYRGDVEHIGVEAFRQQILLPALNAIQQRRLGDQIDYLVYSSDFPWSIDLAADVKGAKLPQVLSPTASINGLTYLWQLVVAKNPNVLSLKSNFYVQEPYVTAENSRSFGFRSWYGWGPRGDLLESGGNSYLLSTMLGVTSGRGNSVEEIIRYLTRAAAADGTHPKGTIYFMKNGDVRSTTRDPKFAAAVRELELLGVKAEVHEGRLPEKRDDVQGAVVGTADFDWAKSGSTILPGAICEHLTSFGGNLRKGMGQTPLTEFLRHGAAGASGTVTEPYAIQAKFPLASIQVHYARGGTLAEAFYQSVAGPYQLLIVGDPLCRPWARIPQVFVEGYEAGQVIKGTVTLKPMARVADGQRVDRYELFVDGQRHDRCTAREAFELDTRDLSDGYHELRIVGSEAGPIETQGHLVLPVTVDNFGRTLELTSPSSGKVPASATITVSAKSSGATGIAIMHLGQVVGRIMGESGETKIDLKSLGRGPVTLQAIALGGQPLQSKPLKLEID